ncbi:MAG: SLBB domain-containing protein [Bacteroidales bacterium]|nr:SLBB domain-containing protein [Bacteroidales bacterium]
MKKRLLTWILGGLFLPFLAMAQSPIEIEAAKSMAKSYGYSENEIEAFLSSAQSGGQTRGETGLATSDSDLHERDGTTVLKQAQKEKEEEVDPATKIYGHDFFSAKGLSIIPSINAPAPSNYILGPGDDVAIDVWGSSTAKIHSVIGRDGTILVNGVGPVLIGGMSVKRAETTLKNRLSKIYGDLGSGTHIKLTLNRMRSITVNVVGDVTVPGVYALPALAQVSSALFMAGGVEETASVRDIRIYREGKFVGRFDLYDFIFNGSCPAELKLQDGDIISVPSYHAIVTLDGDVKRPMKYEILEGETVGDLIAYAGGFGDYAATESVYLERLGTAKGSSYQIRNEELHTFAVTHGDLIYVNSRTREYANRVCVRGSVRQPGMYPISSQIPDVKALIEAAGGLAEDAFKERATLFRKDEHMRSSSVNVNLDDILSGKTQILLAREDSLHVYSAVELQDSTVIRIYGAVRTEGELTFRPGMSVYDAIMESGGFTEGADRSNIEVARKGRGDKGFVKHIDLTANPEDGAEALQPEDAIFIRPLLYYRDPQTITIAGEVNFPGTYVIDKNVVRLSDIIQRAGMFTSDAYVKGAQLERSITKTEKARMETAIELASQEIKGKDKDGSLDSLKNHLKDLYTIGIDLEKAMKNPGSDADVILRTGDSITVPVMNNTVKISGAVFYPNTVVYNPKFSWRDYINQAGGRRRGTKASKIYAVYMNGMVAKKGSANFKMEPGMELVVTSEPKEERKLTTAEIVTIASSSTSVAYMMTALVRMFIPNQ